VRRNFIATVHALMKFTLLVVLLCLFVGSYKTASAQAAYTDSMFARALKGRSTSPLYVLLTIRQKHGANRRACIQANALLGALNMEYNVPYDDAGTKKVIRMAMELRKQGFAFKNHKARANIEPCYSESQLAFVHGELSRLSTPELKRQVKDSASLVYVLCQGRSSNDGVAYRER
jgi:hypothetical protein